MPVGLEVVHCPSPRPGVSADVTASSGSGCGCFSFVHSFCDAHSLRLQVEHLSNSSSHLVATTRRRRKLAKGTPRREPPQGSTTTKRRGNGRHRAPAHLQTATKTKPGDAGYLESEPGPLFRSPGLLSRCADPWEVSLGFKRVPSRLAPLTLQLAEPRKLALRMNPSQTGKHPQMIRGYDRRAPKSTLTLKTGTVTARAQARTELHAALSNACQHFCYQHAHSQRGLLRQPGPWTARLLRLQLRTPNARRKTHYYVRAQRD